MGPKRKSPPAPSPTTTASPNASAVATPVSTSIKVHSMSHSSPARSPRAVLITHHPAENVSSIPYLLRFVLAAIISMSLSSLLNTIAVEFTGPALAQVSRSLSADYEVGAVLGWRLLELALFWYSEFGTRDVAALTFLTHAPHAYLVHTFYDVDGTHLGTYLLINVLANAIPFALLRRLPSSASSRQQQHKRTSSQTGQAPQPVRGPQADLSTAATTVLLGSALYALPLFVSLTTWLPASLAVHFDGLHTLVPAHSASFPSLMLLPWGLWLGYSSYSFLFIPLLSASPSTLAASSATGDKEFEPATATLWETLHYNVFWPTYLPSRQRHLVLRAFVLVGWTAANTTFLTGYTLEGVEMQGAATWAGLWATSAALNALVIGWVAGSI